MVKIDPPRKFPLVRTGWTLSVNLAVVLCMAITSVPQAAGQSGLRKLFTTPTLRAELDRRRLRALQTGTAVEPLPVNQPVSLEELEAERPEPDTIIRLGGSMRRSDGSYTIWVNNTPLAEADLPANMELVSPYNQGQMRIRNPATGETFLVKPGQVLNLTQGQLMESYEYVAPAVPAPIPVAVTQSPAGNSDPGSDTTEENAAATGSAAQLINQARELRDSRQ